MRSSTKSTVPRCAGVLLGGASGNDDRMNVHELDPSGTVIVDGHSVVDLIGEMWAEHADVVVIPVERLDPQFFQLSTGVAGDVLQTFVTYG